MHIESPLRIRKAFGPTLLGAGVALAMLLSGGPAQAAPREHVFAWIAPPEPVDSFRIYLGVEPRNYQQSIELGFIPADADGITRWAIQLEDSIGFYAAATASNSGAESGFSNEVFIAPALCDASACDDSNPCTVDDCDLSGCTHTLRPDGASCGAGGEVCLSGTCQIVECSDGNICNGLETLGSDGVCVAGVPPVCGEPTQCADPVCDPIDGCAMIARGDGTPCDDGNPNTELDRCEVGWCVGDPVAAGECAEGDACPQTSEQRSCLNTLTQDLKKVSTTLNKRIKKCLSQQASTGTPVVDCMQGGDAKLAEVRARAQKHESNLCTATPPDFGPTGWGPVYGAAFEGSVGILTDMFGAVFTAPPADDPLAGCQARTFKLATKCQQTRLKQFKSCQSTGLKEGTIASEASLAACFDRDPKGKIEKICSRIETHAIAEACVETGVDLRSAFPGYRTADPVELATEIERDVECRVCSALNATHGIALDCSATCR